MNAAASHVRLALPLIFGGVWFQLVTLFLIGFLVTVSVWEGNDTWIYAIAFGLVTSGTIVGYRPETARYRTLNLSSGLYRRHFLIGLTLLLFVIAIFFALILMRTDHARWWVIAGIVLVLYGAQALTETNLSQPGRLADRVRDGSVPAPKNVRGEDPVVDDLEHEMIVRPQRNFWVSMWASIVGASTVWLLLVWLWGDEGATSSAIPAVVSVALIMTVMTGTFSDNLSQWVAFGGSRTRWAKKTRLVMLINPLAGAVSLAVLALLGVVQTTGAALGFIAATLLAPVLVVLLQLTARATAVYMGAGFVLAVAGLGALIVGQEWILCAVAVVCFVGFEILLPCIARAYNPFASGLSAFFGMRKQAA